MPNISPEKATDILLCNGIVAVPTETVYGLAARADSVAAIEKIYIAKQRPRDNPLICHFDSIPQIKQYLPDFPPIAEQILNFFAPGPISVLVPLPLDSSLLPATGGRPAVICRIPANDITRQIIRDVGVPLAAPSANTSGKVSPTTAEMVETDLGSRIDGIVDGGPCSVGLESTIVDCRNPNILTILRPGCIGVYEIEEMLQVTANRDGKIIPQMIFSPHTNVTEPTPGSKYRHYAPQTPIFPFSTEIILPGSVIIGSKEALKEAALPSTLTTLSLGTRTDMFSIARSFYQTLFTLDKKQVRAAYIISTDWPENSITTALRNRLDKIFSAG